MGVMKFASLDEAIQHLSNLTSKRIKIAWEDQSKEMMKAIAQSIVKNPALLVKLKKNKSIDVDKILQESGVEKDSRILPTNKGSLKIVKDIPKEVVVNTAKELAGIKDLSQRSKIIDYVSKDESFENFHTKYPKGVQKDESGPYYRGKQGLIQRGVDKIRKEKGEEGVSDRVSREKLEKEQQENAKIIDQALKGLTKQAKGKMKNLSDTKSKDEFELLLDAPANPLVQKAFIKVFEKEIKEGILNSKEAKTYLSIIERMLDFAEDKFGDKLPEFVKSLGVLVSETDEAEDKAEENPTPNVPGNAQNKGKLVDQFGNPIVSSEMDNMISNIVGEWIKLNA